MSRFSRSLHLLLTMLLLIACIPIQPDSTAPTPTTPATAAATATAPATPAMSAEEIYAEAVSRLDQFLALVGEMRTAIDRTQFDLTELGFALGFDAEPLIAFVRDEIAFEQYSGLLRGAQGTLLGRAGNALDQAALLSTLLDNAGYETRVAQGTLPVASATTLVQQMAAPRSAALPPGDAAALREIMTAMAALSFEPPAEMAALVDATFAPSPVTAAPIYETARANSTALLAALDAADIELTAQSEPDQSANAALIAEAQSYFWVEYRLGPGDEWQGAHPAFGSSTPDLADLVADAVHAADLPATLQHKLRVQALIEREADGTRTTEPLFAGWERAVADIVGQPLTYHNHPNGGQELAELADLTTVLAESELFLPILNQQTIPDARAFALNGELFDGSAGADDSFTLSPLGGALGGAAEMLGALGSGPRTSEAEATDADGRLTAHWLVYTLIAPDGSSKEYRRAVWSAPTNDATESVAAEDDATEQAMRSALATQHTFMVAPGALNTAFVLDQVLARVESYGPLLHYMLAQNVMPAEAQPMSMRALATLDNAWLGHLSLYKAFDLIGQTMDDALLYRAEPTLVRFSQQLVDKRVAQAVDVMNNTQRAFVFVDELPVAAPATALQAGVWETLVETALLSGPENVVMHSAASQLSGALAAGQPLQVIRPNDRAALQQLTLSEQSRRALARDLDAGFVVALPLPEPTTELAAWWRVDPTTGTTLGMLGNGYGGVMAQTTTEYIIKVGAHVILFTIAFAHCIGIVATTVGKVGGGQIIGCLGLSLAFAFARFPTDAVDGVLLLLSITGLFVC